MSTLYATFIDASLAQKAAGALLDHGAAKDDISVIGNETCEESLSCTKPAEEGVTTTTGADAAVGAAMGAGVGLGLGLVGALAAIIIPGFGIVVGGGTLAMALAAAFGTAAGGALAGGVAGFLVDQGMSEQVARDYEAALEHGSALLAIDVPSGPIDRILAVEILTKYGASQIRSVEDNQPGFSSMTVIESDVESIT